MRLCVELGSGPKLPAVIDVTLVHPAQHMLFLGTEKYPDENSYSAFLNQHGGNSNAYTASEYTNYYFDVQASFLEVCSPYVPPVVSSPCVFCVFRKRWIVSRNFSWRRCSRHPQRSVS
jgi:Insulinase (Peptidase family M16)